METIEETVNQIRSITKIDILEVLPKLLDLDNKALVFYGPKINKTTKQEIENEFKYR
jgi:predicted Zn-dependent peptidase